MIRPALQLEPASVGWQSKAACRDHAPDLFFPKPRLGGGRSETVRIRHQIQNAKAVCSGCEVRQLCLEFAMGHETGNNRYGIYGGLTDEERATLGRRRARARRSGHAV